MFLLRSGLLPLPIVEDDGHFDEPSSNYRSFRTQPKVWIEPLFGEAKQWHGMRQFRLRGLMKVNMEGLLIAAGQNLKRLLSAKGWGRRPWPDGEAGFTDMRPQMCATST